MIKRRFNKVEQAEIVTKSQQCLWSSEGKKGLSYLKEIRQLSEDTLKRFSVGYLPQNIRHQLAGRIILPILDPSGHIVAVSSRRLGDEDDGLPVYWHESYDKSFYLYGIRYAVEAMRRWNFALVVEGQFDVMQLHDHGMRNAVGLCSTNITDVQTAIIHRYCDELVLLLDKDANLAGQRGVTKALSKTSLLSGRNLKKVVVVTFEENTDPDEFIRKHGISALKQKIKRSLLEMRRKHGIRSPNN